MSVSAHDIARALDAQVEGPSDKTVERIDTAADATERSLVFVRNESFADNAAASAAGTLLVQRDLMFDKPDAAVIRVDNVDLALNTVLEMLAPPARRPDPGIHPTAIVDRSAKIGLGVHIGPYCIVGPDAFIGDGDCRACVRVPGRRSVDRSRPAPCTPACGSSSAARSATAASCTPTSSSGPMVSATSPRPTAPGS